MTRYFTTDTGELAPYPDMTSDDLRDFEAYSDEVDENWNSSLMTALACASGLVWVAIFLWATS